jgi:cytochrome c oxidase assembly factor CtaG
MKRHPLSEALSFLLGLALIVAAVVSGMGGYGGK